MLTSEENLNNLKYPNPSDATKTIHLPVGNCCLICAIQAYNSFLCFENNSPIIDWILVTLDDFNTFQISVYDPNMLIMKFWRISVHGTPGHAITGNVRLNLSSPSTPKFLNFMQGVKWNKIHYKPFKLECYWDDWNYRFWAIAKTHDMTGILDSSYTASTLDDRAYSIFEEHQQMDMGKTLVCQYESKSDAQKIYEELCKHMKLSAAGTLATSKLLQ